LLGVVERIFAICLHVSLSVVVLYGIAVNRPAWYGLAVLWHTVVDGVAAYLALLKVNTLTIEGLIGLMAIVSIGLVFPLRGKFPAAAPGLDQRRLTIRNGISSRVRKEAKFKNRTNVLFVTDKKSADEKSPADSFT